MEHHDRPARSFVQPPKPVRYRVCFLSLVCLLTACGVPSGTQLLVDQWQFRNGFEASYLGGGNQGAWRTASFPLKSFPLLKTETASPTVVTVRHPLSDLQSRLLRSGKALAFFSGTTSDVAEFYLDANRFGSFGSSDPYKSGFDRRGLLTLPAPAPSATGPDYIYVVLRARAPYPLEIQHPPPFVGEANQTALHFYGDEILHFALLAVYAFGGLYHLILFARRRVDLYNLYFGAFCGLASAYWFFQSNLRDVVFGSQVMIRTRVEYILLYALGPLLALFFRDFLERRLDRVAVAYSVFYGILAIFTAFGSLPTATLCLTIWNYTAIPFLAYGLLFVGWHIFKKNRYALRLMVGLLVIMVAAGHDILSHLGYIDQPHISRFAFLVLISNITAILGHRYMQVHARAEELTHDLERKVLERTESLQATLDEIHELKLKQDADYFLTSRLLGPLGGNFSSHDSIDVQLLVRQKKRFRFKKWEAELGGDLSAAHTIVLRGRSYTAFLNGDAMGKSMQGAGGAIVLGTAFKAQITRTQTSALAQDRAPEWWLKSCFRELQSVFVSFDGQMLASAIVGLLDNESGVLYHINAEHPPAVHLRGGVARYLHGAAPLMKLGIEERLGTLQVATHRLKPGDIVICGTDGRDDLEVTRDGHRRLNEDEQLFLEVVERTGGDLSAIHAGLARAGSFTDDLSLLRVGFFPETAVESSDVDSGLVQRIEKAERAVATGQFSSALATLQPLLTGRGNSGALRLAARAAVALEEYELAAQYLARYVDQHPADTDALYLAGFAHNAFDDAPRAAEYCERVRTRNRTMLRNLITLADAHRKLFHRDRATKIIREALSLAPRDSDALAVHDQIMAMR